MNFDNNSNALHTIRFINGTNRSVFLTGKAGTGKTTLLRTIVNNTHKNTVIVAPTGIAALNAGGVTIHSMFQIPFGAFVPAANLHGLQSIPFQIHTLAQLPSKVQINSTKRAIIRQMELLIIDEVSMLRADVLDAIDTILRHIRKKRHEAFGGVQVLFIGDMLQLPPIVKDDEWNLLQHFYQSMYFFDALVCKQQPPITIELETIYRQSDQSFIQILNNLRNNIFLPEDIALLNTHVNPNFIKPPKQSYIFITTHNKKADAINASELQNISTESFFFNASLQGDFPENMYPLEYTLELKIGAQIMFIKNDYSGGNQYFNGKIGIIQDIFEQTIFVEFPESGTIVEVEKYTWENKRYSLNTNTGLIEESVIGTFTHYPIKLAWAVTVHKSQGLTFSHAIIDVSEAFAPGQIYVALSRLESLNGLVLHEPIFDNAPEQSKHLLEFSNNKYEHEQLIQEYARESIQYLHTSIIETFDFQALEQEFSFHIQTYNKEEKRSAKQQYLSEMLTIQSKVPPIVEIAKKFKSQLSHFIHHNTASEILTKRIEASIGYFEPLLESISTQLFDLIDRLQVEKGVKAYITEIKNLEIHFFNKIQRMKKCILLIEAIEKNQPLEKKNLSPQTNIEYRITNKVTQTKKQKVSTAKHSKLKDSRNTREISFEMFEAGMDIAQIAKERSLSVTTIETHLAYFVAEGMIQIDELLDKQDLTSIQQTIIQAQTTSLKTIKDALPAHISYSKLKFALAYLEFSNQLSNVN